MRPLTEIGALQLLRDAARQAPPTPQLRIALAYLDGLIVHVVEHGEARIRLGMNIEGSDK